jgi:hypothetical protein
MLLNTMQQIENVFTLIGAGLQRRGLYYHGEYALSEDTKDVTEFIVRVGVDKSSLTSTERGVQRVAFILSGDGVVDIYVGSTWDVTEWVDDVDDFIRCVLDNTHERFVDPPEEDENSPHQSVDASTPQPVV